MQWKKLTIKNFMSIKEAELYLDDKGLVLIEGKNLTNNAFQSNGSGKSSLLDGIVYAIYDTTSKGVKANDVINRNAKKNMVVILEGESGKDKYRIERYRKHSKYKDTVKLFINDKDVSEKSVKDTNALIENIVGIDYNTFINSIMFSQGNGAGRFATATDKEKKEILENLVNLEVYGKAQELAKERVKQKEEEILNKEREIEKLQWEITKVDSLEQQDKENYENTKMLIKQETDNIKRNVEEMTEYAKNNFDRVEKTRKEIELLYSKRDNLKTVDISAKTEQVNDVYKKLKNKEMELDKLNNKKEELLIKYKQIQQDTNCPVCGNILDKQHRERELLTIKEELKSVLLCIKRVTGELTELTTVYNEVHTDYEKYKEAYEKANDNYRNITKAIQDREQLITVYENTIQEYKNKSEYAQQTVDKLRNVPKPKSREEERKSIREGIKNVKKDILDLTKEKNKLEDVVKVFSNSGVKSHVLDLVTPFLNEKANTYLSILSGSDIEINFSTQRRNKNGELVDKFDVQVFNSKGGESYKANSEGEKKRIDLAISLAIQDLVMSKPNLSTNFVVYDEVFDALDGVGCENVIELLRERLKTVSSIFVITHNEHLKPLFEQVITVEKNKAGESKVIEGERTS